MSSQVEAFGMTESGETVRRVIIEDGIRVAVLTFGAVLQRIEAPGRDGRAANVALGLESLDGYVHRSPYFGAVPGRYAGRIGGARFTLDSVEYQLPKNEGDTCLHGGPAGFGKRVWTLDAAARSQVTLSYLSQDGEAGFPGTLQTGVTYTADGTTLRIDYEATTDRPTVLNLTNHSYFNLAGEGSGDVFAHTLQIEADGVLKVRPDSIPTGAILPVEGTPFDFRAPEAIGKHVRAAHPQMLIALGYDQCFVLRGDGFRRAATLRHPASGRALDVWTDQPGMQLYTGNKLTGALAGPSARTYRSGDGVALETQHFPDSPNRPEFPSTVLRPGQRFRSTTELRFGVEI